MWVVQDFSVDKMFHECIIANWKPENHFFSKIIKKIQKRGV